MHSTGSSRGSTDFSVSYGSPRGSTDFSDPYGSPRGSWDPGPSIRCHLIRIGSFVFLHPPDTSDVRQYIELSLTSLRLVLGPQIRISINEAEIKKVWKYIGRGVPRAFICLLLKKSTSAKLCQLLVTKCTNCTDNRSGKYDSRSTNLDIKFITIYPNDLSLQILRDLTENVPFLYRGVSLTMEQVREFVLVTAGASNKKLSFSLQVEDWEDEEKEAASKVQPEVKLPRIQHEKKEIKSSSCQLTHRCRNDYPPREVVKLSPKFRNLSNTKSLLKAGRSLLKTSQNRPKSSSVDCSFQIIENSGQDLQATEAQVLIGVSAARQAVSFDAPAAGECTEPIIVGLDVPEYEKVIVKEELSEKESQGKLEEPEVRINKEQNDIVYFSDIHDTHCVEVEIQASEKSG